jgi:hypothetical protein
LHYPKIKNSRKKTSILISQKRLSANISKKLLKQTVKMSINHIKNNLFKNISINNPKTLKFLKIYGPS